MINNKLEFIEALILLDFISSSHMRNMQSSIKENDMKVNKTPITKECQKINSSDKLKTQSQTIINSEESKLRQNQDAELATLESEDTQTFTEKKITGTSPTTNNSCHCETKLKFLDSVSKNRVPFSLKTPIVTGYNFNNGINYSALLASYKHSGFQATNFGLAVEEILRMLVARKIPLIPDQIDNAERDEFIKRRHCCTIFLGYTSDDTISKGVRETIRFLAEHRMIDCIITTTNAIEEDLIDCLAPTQSQSVHAFSMNLKNNGFRNIEKDHSYFESWIFRILDKMLEEQKKGVLWTPSKIIARLGEEINNKHSIYYWAAKNKIPVFSPGLTANGRFGNAIYFHSFKSPGLVIDILSDLRRINTVAIKAITSGTIVIGGGIVKHHIFKANLMRNGADFGVFINAIPEYDGSDSGARPDEAVSWGKIKKESKAVKICAEASIIFPLLIAETFVRHFMSYKMRIVTTV